MRRALALFALATLVAVAACSGDDENGGGPPRPEDTSTTAVIDYSGVALGSVKGTTTTTIPMSGTAAILGSVSGPSGPVGGATVRIERLVGGTSTVVDVLSGIDGHYEQRNLPGGRYRVRAFQAPALALVEPQLQFVAAGAEQTVDLVMTDQRAIRARAAVAPSTPYVGDDVNLAVIIGSQRVDADGIVRTVPVVGVRVELDGLGAWGLRDRPTGGFQVPGRITSTTATFSTGSTTEYTDGSGQVRYSLECEQAGSPGLSVNVSVTVTPTVAPGESPALPVQQLQSVPLVLPDCVDPAAVVATTPTTEP